MSQQQTSEQAGIELTEQFFLPSFCEVQLVFAVVMITELLAIILTLVTSGTPADFWGNLGLLSMFMQWIALASAAVLCLCRPVLSRMGNSAAALVSYLLVLTVTVLVTALAFWLMSTSPLFPDVTGDQHELFLLRSLTISSVVAAIVLRYLYVQFQWRQQVNAEARARVQALQARIRPHFLFNSLNTIAALTRSAPRVAETAVEDLSDLYRAALNSSHERTTLADEITLSQRYLNIEALRLGERLSVQWDMDAVPTDAPMPPLILQPLLENAIYHGIERLPEGGMIQIEGEYIDGSVTITISNPVPPDGSFQQSGNRIAQENIRQRLQLAYGARAGLTSTLTDGCYQLQLRFPAAGEI